MGFEVRNEVKNLKFTLDQIQIFGIYRVTFKLNYTMLF